MSQTKAEAPRKRRAKSVHEDVKWTNLTQQQIAAGLDAAGTPVSVSVVRKLRRRFNYKRRKPSKVLPLGR
ncbi:MAG: hypothetical protein WD872_20640, partial [Pirellulaceae bacterium]